MKLVQTFNLFNKLRSFNSESFGTKQLRLCMIVSGRAKILNSCSVFEAGLENFILRDKIIF